MKMFAMLIPALMVGSLALAQGEPAAAGAATGGDAPKTAKEAKKNCKAQSNGDHKAFKACMKEWKKSQGK